MENTKKVAIIMGSDSDWPTVKAAAAQLKSWDIPFEVRVMSAHRTPAAAAEFAKRAAENGFGVIIAAAGMAAHLAGSIAANTVLPVVGIPVKGGAVDGLDALLATRADAQRHSCGHRCAERRQKRRRAGRSDAGHPRRAHRRAAGGGPGENGPLHR